MPDTVQIPMWGFGLQGGSVTVPGPELVVPPGDTTLTINLQNNLAVPVSIIIPGLTPAPGDITPVRNPDGRVRSFVKETSPGGTSTYTFTVKPGTYLYQSGSHQQIQVPMGLYGAVKNDAAAGQAYAGVNYSQDKVILFSEIDPVINNAVSTGNYGPGQAITSIVDYTARYFLINGTPFSAGAPPLLTGSVGQDILLRFLNAGLLDYVPIVQGVYMTIWAEDGNKLPYPKRQYSLLLSAGKTMDASIQSNTPQVVSLYDRRLNLTNNSTSPGGMLTYLNIGNLAFPAWASISGATPSTPALAGNSGANNLQMVVRASDNSLWASTFSSTGAFNNNWISIPGMTPSTPALAWNPVAGNVQMVVRAADNSLWASTFNSAGTFNNDWTALPGPVTATSFPALAWDATAGNLEMVVRTADSSLWASTFSSAGVFNNDWTLISGMSPSSPALAWNPGAALLQIVVQAADGSLWAAVY
jgi:FtsP/CotA-like multicopper oxidase with cupredoxin domain